MHQHALLRWIAPRFRRAFALLGGLNYLDTLLSDGHLRRRDSFGFSGQLKLSDALKDDG